MRMIPTVGLIAYRLHAAQQGMLLSVFRDAISLPLMLLLHLAQPTKVSLAFDVYIE